MAFPKKVKKTVVTVQFEMDEQTAKLFTSSAIERVINNSMNRAIAADISDEDAQVNYQDWQEWKPVVCGMWGAVRDAIFRIRAELPPAEEPFKLHKGDL